MRTLVALVLTSSLVGCTLTGSGVAKTEHREVAHFDTIVAADIVDVLVRSDAPSGSLEVRCDDNVIDHLETHVTDGVLTVGFGGAGVSVSTACAVVTGNMALVEVVSSGVGTITVDGPAWSLATVRAESVGSIQVDLRPGSHEEAATELLEEGASSERLLQDDGATEPLGHADHITIETLDIGEVQVSGLSAQQVDVWSESTGDVVLHGQTEGLVVDAHGLGHVNARQLTAREVEIHASSVAHVTATATESVDVENTGIGAVIIYGDPDTRSVVDDNVGEVVFR